MARKSWLAAAVAACIWVTVPAAAEEPANGWQFSMTPYLWAPSMSGELTVRGRSAPVDASIVDIVGKADSIIGFMSQFELHNGRWGVFFAPTYMNLTADGNASVGPLSLAADVSSSLLFLEFGGVYRLTEWGDRGSRGTASGGNLELLFGGRYTDIGAEIDLEVGGLPPGFAGALKVDKSVDWVEPFVGARTLIRLSDRWLLSLRGDAGGFGAGSELALQGIGVVGYEIEVFGRDAIAFGGYRALYQDYEDGSGTNQFEWDMTLHGPILGLNVRF